MTKPVYIFLLAALCIVLGSVHVSAEKESDATVLDELVDMALSNNPDLKAAENRWLLFEKKIVPAGSLSDPSLSFALNNYPKDSFAADEFAMTGNVFRLSQSFPFPGKLAAKEKAAEHQAIWYKGLWQDGKLQLTRLVKDAYFSLYYFTKAVEITNKNLELLDDFIRLTETNYEVGKGLQQDVLRAQVERSRLLDKLYSLEQKRETALAELNRLLNRPSSTGLANLTGFEFPDVDIALTELQKQSETNRPMYAAYKALVDRYKAEQKLAQLDYRPDFKVGLAYTQREANRADDGTDFVGIEFGMTLPIFRAKRVAAVEEASAGIRMALEQYNDFRNKVFFNIHDAYTRMRKNRDQAVLYKSGIIPQAAQTFEAALSNYQVGKIGFLVLLDSLVDLYDYELDYYKALTDSQRSLAKLESETGVAFDLSAEETGSGS